MGLPRFKAPDSVRRSVRLALGVSISVCVGYLLMEELTERGHHSWGTQVLQGSKWSAITCIVVSAPVVGKVAQTSLERLQGTALGGCLGYFVAVLGFFLNFTSDAIFVTACAGIVACTVGLLGSRWKKDYSANLFVMTFILVVMGSTSPVDALSVALSRTGGISFGVVLSLLLSMVVFPKSATHQCTDLLGRSLKALCRLNTFAWEQEAGEAAASSTPTKPAGSRGSPGGVSPLACAGKAAGDAAAREEECEASLMEVYNSVKAAMDLLELTESEVYVATLRGRWFFMPRIPGLHTRHSILPKEELWELAAAMRRVARVLRALYVTMQDGFAAELRSVLALHHPPGFMRQLAGQSGACLEDMAAAFPGEELVPDDNLDAITASVEMMIRISDNQRQRSLRFMRQTVMPAFAASPPQSRKPLLGAEEAAENGAPPESPLLPFELESVMEEHSPTSLSALNGGGNLGPFHEGRRLTMFADSREGYMNKMRWYSFQFLMQQLVDELGYLHASLSDTLAKLPRRGAVGRGVRSRHQDSIDPESLLLRRGSTLNE